MPASFIPSTVGLSRENAATQSQLEERVQARAREIFSVIEGKKPSVFDSTQWTGKLMSWAMSKPDFRVRLLRFVDAYPSVSNPGQLHRLIQEYFVADGGDIPAFLRFGAQTSGFLGRAGHSVMNVAIRKNLEMMAHQFIVGSGIEEAMRGAKKLRKEEYAVILDLLGEAVVTEKEAEEHLQSYLAVLDQFADQKLNPIRASEQASLDWDSAPIAQISVKPSALYSLVDPLDFEGSVNGILGRLRKIVGKANETGAAVCLDMESYRLKDITIEVFRRLRSENPGYQNLGIVLQAYLRETEADLRNLLAWMREENLPSAIRLVKGAYWDCETVIAAQNGWANRVWEQKPQTDANFEKCSRILLENSDICYFACASHNIRSIAVVLETARKLKVAADCFEFQLLYGMAEPVRDAIRDIAGRVRLYAPFGELIPGMAYLVRRILENTANQSFLRATFGEETDMGALLKNPVDELRKSPPKTRSSRESEFRNVSTVDFTIAANRTRMQDAIAGIRASGLGEEHFLVINGEKVESGNLATSFNPNLPDEVLGRFHLGRKGDASNAIASAQAAFLSWKKTSQAERSAILNRAADLCEERRFELASWAILEVGKQWQEASGEIEEMIDFFRYYAREAERLSLANSLLQLPGEANSLSNEGRGVTAVIAPWNFPFAISAGMIAAALVTGNTVVFKPSGLSAITGSILVALLHDAGLPDGVLNFVPGSGREIGGELNIHPDVATIAFTGSRQTGLRIIERAAVTHPEQRHVKRVIAEMGGKNAIIVDDDADLDEAVPAVLRSAFGFQGQKCSACSRVIVLDSVHDRFVNRLVDAAKGWKLGPSEDPQYHMGALINESALAKFQKYASIAKEEGDLAFESECRGRGSVAPIMIFTGIKPEHRIAQEEVFGPLLVVMRVRDFDEALVAGNSTDYALTGGVFSRTPSHLERARREFDVGNLYLNRGITGALVGRQAFGGSAMSGVGSKAGGPDYLLQFMNPKVVTENTMRRGFAPDAP
tara:strand:+ start:6662 stop:9676 length:3015 start_codon:yes stop_codon:yes gene_type:complete